MAAVTSDTGEPLSEKVGLSIALRAAVTDDRRFSAIDNEIAAAATAAVRNR